MIRHQIHLKFISKKEMNETYEQDYYNAKSGWVTDSDFNFTNSDQSKAYTFAPGFWDSLKWVCGFVHLLTHHAIKEIRIVRL